MLLPQGAHGSASNKTETGNATGTCYSDRMWLSEHGHPTSQSPWTRGCCPRGRRTKSSWDSGSNQRTSWLAALEILGLSTDGNNFQRDGVRVGHVKWPKESSTPSLNGGTYGLCHRPDLAGRGLIRALPFTLQAQARTLRYNSCS